LIIVIFYVTTSLKFNFNNDERLKIKGLCTSLFINQILSLIL